MPSKVQPIPKGLHTVTANLVCRDAAKAIEWYQKAFGAKENSRFFMPDGKIGHAELTIGDSRIMLNDEMQGMGKSPQMLNGTPVSFFMYVPDCDAVFERALKAGGQSTMPMADMFWGDRCGQVKDPFGHLWTIATRKEELSPEEMRKRGEAFFKKNAAARA